MREENSREIDTQRHFGLRTSPDAHFLTLISTVEHQFSLSLDRVLRKQGVTFRQFVALARISHAPGLSIADLARALLTTPQNVATLVNRLESQGYVICRRAQRGQSAALDLTKSGQAFLHAAEAVALEAEVRVGLV